MKDLDRFYPIVDSAVWVERLVAAGARLIQLRVKERAQTVVRAQTRAALALCARYGAQLVVNDYWEIAIDEGADFIHLGQGDLDGADIARIRGRGLRVGISTHDHAELDRALSFDPDYVALGPIYPTILKAMAFAPQGLARIGEWKRLVGKRPAGRHRRHQSGAGAAMPCRRRRQRGRRHRHHAQPRSGRPGQGLACGDAEGGLTHKTPVGLTIAGSNLGGGAGVQADLKTFAALGVYSASALTAVTAQNTLGVRAVCNLPATILTAQIDAIFDDFNVAAVKIGMLSSLEIVEAVADALLRFSPRFVVLDPVTIASSGEPLIGLAALSAMKTRLIPRVDCLTPNLSEAAALLGGDVAADEAGMTEQGLALLKLGPRAVLMKGGHLESADAVDILVTQAGARRFAGARIASRNLHGTGCRFQRRSRLIS